MNKCLLITIVGCCIMLISSCGASAGLTFNQNQLQTNVVLSQNNFTIVKHVCGESSGTYQRISTRPKYYFMNWGLGDVTNTWYITDDVRPSEDYYEFSFLRKDIVDITPEDN